MNFEKIIDFLKDKISTFLEICKRLFSLFMVKVFNPLRTKVDYFQCKYLHKGQLKKFVIIRYIVKELTLYFLVCFLFFFMIFFVNQILLLAEQILKQRVPFADVARLMLYCLPGVISQSAPFATLVGFLMCLGRLMSDNEILIFRASGQSYKLVLIPVLVLGMVISIVSFFVNDYLLPVGNMKFSKLKREIAVANPTIEIESNSIKRLKNSTIIIGDVNDKEVSDIVFFDKGSDGNQRIVVAGKSEIQNAQKEGVIMHMNMLCLWSIPRLCPKEPRRYKEKRIESSFVMYRLLIPERRKRYWIISISQLNRGSIYLSSGSMVQGKRRLLNCYADCMILRVE